MSLPSHQARRAPLRARQLIVVLLGGLLFVDVPARATVVQRSFTVDPGSVQIVDVPAGKEATYTNPEPVDFALFDGDSMDITLTFTNPMTIKDLGTGFDNFEHVFVQETANFSSCPSATFSRSIEFTGISGDVLVNPIGRSSFDGNLTDTSFTFMGIHYQTAVGCPGSPAETGSGFGFQFTADDIQLQGARSCGDGMVDTSAEQCDEGSAVNGTLGSCCTADCKLQGPTHVCRPSRSTLCDPAESCDGLSPACPPDEVADGMACLVGDVCTIKDHCEMGVCVPGPAICDVRVSSPRAPLIRVECAVVRENVGEGRAFCEARAVFPSAPAAQAPTASADAADCLTGESATDMQRRVLKGDRTTIRLKLNPRARKALRKARELQLDVCAKIGLPNNNTVSVQKPVAVMKRR